MGWRDWWRNGQRVEEGESGSRSKPSIDGIVLPFPFILACRTHHFTPMAAGEERVTGRK